MYMQFTFSMILHGKPGIQLKPSITSVKIFAFTNQIKSKPLEQLDAHISRRPKWSVSTKIKSGSISVNQLSICTAHVLDFITFAIDRRIKLMEYRLFPVRLDTYRFIGFRYDVVWFQFNTEIGYNTMFVNLVRSSLTKRN